MKIDVSEFSKKYRVRLLGSSDVAEILSLCEGNPQFYEHCPPFVTEQSIIDDMKALPPRKDYSDKYYVGYFDGEKLIAVMDFIMRFRAERGRGERNYRRALRLSQRHWNFSRPAGLDRQQPAGKGLLAKESFRQNRLIIRYGELHGHSRRTNSELNIRKKTVRKGGAGIDAPFSGREFFYVSNFRSVSSGHYFSCGTNAGIAP